MSFLLKGLPQSTKEAISQASSDKIVDIVKSVIQEHVKSLFDATGVNRTILEALGGRGLQYHTDLHLPNDLTADKRRIQIERMVDKVKEHLPAILIADSGMSYIRSGLGKYLNRVRIDSGEKDEKGNTIYNNYVQFSNNYIVPCTVIVAAKDTDTTNSLKTILSLTFGELRNMLGAHEITGNPANGENWVVRIPNTHSISPNSADNMPDDNREQKNYSEISIDVEFENILTIKKDAFKVDARQGGSTVDGALNLNAQIIFPDEIVLGNQYQIVVRNKKDFHRLTLSNGKVATFNPETLLLTPKKIGNFDINLVNLRKASNQRSPEIVATKSVTINYK